MHTTVEIEGRSVEKFNDERQMSIKDQKHIPKPSIVDPALEDESDTLTKSNSMEARKSELLNESE